MQEVDNVGVCIMNTDNMAGVPSVVICNSHPVMYSRSGQWNLLVFFSITWGQVR